ncbi:MAG TPA: homoserine dehydrogenase [Aliidongia sp.]|uniref:homoserine dehydrogenase n=1 Tax=Aliidongia sp. TaxID=1914230 RepID=UPI002DDCEC5B|nr:homoserine dehydrogenase [Aliidongia sp.]HEV2674915.1 homoserine dehydrogenase [Aliidongia sp.]
MVESAPLRIGIAGLGTVGAGVVRLLEENRDLLIQRAGRRIEIAAVSARRRDADRGVDLGAYAWHDDPLTLAEDPAVDVVVELIGGEAGPALALVEHALANGKSVVTANKALLAHHGSRLGRIARQRGTGLCFEASVAGGIPVIKVLREGLVGNRISRISGILNGTCNYILSTMRETGRAFDDVLADAQKLGYAEADPTLDIDGFDAAHKLAVLAGIAFGTPVDFDQVYVEGIRHISPLDIEYAEELGYRIKLLGTAVRTARGIEQRVHPTMVQASEAIAQVDGVFNAVVIEGDHVGRVVLQGRGAGAGPTASAVVSDLVDLACGRPSPAFVEAAETGIGPVSMTEHDGPSYIRLMVRDQPGVIADIAAELRNERVSMEAMIQRRHQPDGAVPVVLTTHPSKEAALSRALERIGALDSVLEPPRMIRIEL